MGKKYKIVHITPFFEPSIGYEDYYTPKYMAKLGHDVTVITSNVSFDFKRRFEVGESKTDGLKIIRLPYFFRYGSDFILYRGLYSVLKRIRPEFVYLHNARQWAHYIAARKKKKLGYVLFVDHHDFFFPGHSMRPSHNSFRNIIAKIEYSTFRRWLSRSIFNRADRVVSVTKVCNDHLREYFKVPEEKIITMEFAVDVDVFHFEESERKKIRKEYQIKENDFVLNYTGIITRRKKFEKIIRLLSHMKTKEYVTNFKIMVVGYFNDQNYEEEIKKLLQSKRLSENIIFTGKVLKDKIYAYYSASDLAFWVENNSISILEAMACGLIVVVPNMQLSHIVEDNGVIFPSGDIQALENVILSIQKKTLKERNEMKKKSLELVETKHNYYQYAQRLIEEFERLRLDNNA